jgi:hypothetical protein
MTCTHVLGLIDAGPFADYPRAHLDAAWQHARQCATCGPALQAAAALTDDLKALPRPAAPPDFTAAVLARIAPIERSHSDAVVAAVSDRRDFAGTHDWSTWATALGSLAAGFVVALSMSPGGDGMRPRLMAMPGMTPGGPVLAASLLLYVVGLFAPLSSRSRRPG